MYRHTIQISSQVLRNSKSGFTQQYKHQQYLSYSLLTYGNNSFQDKKEPLCRHMKLNDHFHISQKRNSSNSTFSSYFTTENFAVKCGVEVLECVHDFTGLPWWATIAVSTFALKLCFVSPLFVLSSKVQYRLRQLQPEIAIKSSQIKRQMKILQRRNDWTELETKYRFKMEMKHLQKELYVRDNCHPIRISLPLFVQLPLWFTISIAIRNLAGLIPFKGLVTPLRPDLATGGALWFENLLIPDPFLLLPLCMGVINFGISEINALQKGQKAGWEKALRYTANSLTVLGVLIGTILPSGVVWFWVCSSSYGLIQIIVLQSSRVRSKIGLPTSNSETPYKDLLERAKIRYSLKRKFSKKS